MGEITKIQWCDHTFNPWRGCTKVSCGCANCYAETLSKRNPGVLGVWGPNGTRVVASEAKWREPLKWDKEAKAAGVRRRVFCASLADVFEQWDEPMRNARGHELSVNDAGAIWSYDEGVIDDDWGVREYTMDDVRNRLLGYIVNTPNLDWLLLTKRIESVVSILERLAKGPLGSGRATARKWLDGSPPPNVWLGTSVENQATADARIPHLLRVPAKVRFLSVEPMLGPVDLEPYVLPTRECDCGGMCIGCVKGPLLPRVDWVIFGGESGPGARPCDLAWIRDGVRQCRAAGVAAFVKQAGSAPRTTLPDFEVWPRHTGPKSPVQFSGDGFGNYTVHGLRDKKGGDPSEWPADVRVRETPTTAVHV